MMQFPIFYIEQAKADCMFLLVEMMQPPNFAPSELQNLSPHEVAARLEHLGGLVFLDTSGNVPKSTQSSISIVSAAPSAIHRGHVSEIPSLGAYIDNTKLLGWVDYEGNFVFGEYHDFLIYHHQTATWESHGNLANKLCAPLASDALPGEFTAETKESDYCEAVKRIQEWIASGDIYQVNLAQKFTTYITGEGSLFPLYLALRKASPAPMSAYLAIDHKEVLSTSPELFLKMRERHIETRPIKGTRPRFEDFTRDQKSAEELCSSKKEAAELIMITDLLRNDLGQVSDFGSVCVDRLLELESLEQVHHLVSTVSGSLRQDISHLKALKACFPGGSITGAPKKRSMEIIQELELQKRGIYCGSIGYFGTQESQFNIAIRTLIREKNQLSYQVGAGIVADSNPRDEFQETLDKAQGLKRGIQQFIESKKK